MTVPSTYVSAAQWYQQQEPGHLGARRLGRGLAIETQESLSELRALPGQESIAELLDVLSHLSVQVYGGELETRLGQGAWSDGTYVFVSESFLAQVAHASLDPASSTSWESQGVQPRLAVTHDPRRCLPLHRMLLACADTWWSAQHGRAPRLTYPGVHPAPDASWVQEQIQAVPEGQEFLTSHDWPKNALEDLQSRRDGTHPALAQSRQQWEAMLQASLHPAASDEPQDFDVNLPLPHAHPLNVSIRTSTTHWLREYLAQLPEETPNDEVLSLVMMPCALSSPLALSVQMAAFIETNGQREFVVASTFQKQVLAHRVSQCAWFNSYTRTTLVNALSGLLFSEDVAPGHIDPLRLYLMACHGQTPHLDIAQAQAVFDALSARLDSATSRMNFDVSYLEELPDWNEVFREIVSLPALREVLASVSLRACGSATLLSAALEEQYAHGVPAEVSSGDFSPTSEHTQDLPTAWRHKLWQDTKLERDGVAADCVESLYFHATFYNVRSWDHVDTMLSAGISGGWQEGGFTLLHFMDVVSAFPGRRRAMKALLDHGLDPAAVDIKGCTAWDIQLRKTYFEDLGVRSYSDPEHAFPALVCLLQIGVPFSNTAESWGVLLDNLDGFVEQKKKLPSHHLRVLGPLLDTFFTPEAIGHIKSTSAVADGSPAGQWALAWVSKHEHRLLYDAVTTTTETVRRLRV
jgi:hypothetical protein